jgi:hypothetical protein
VINSMPCNNNSDCLAKFNFTQCTAGKFCECAKGHLEEARECLPIILELNSEWECKINAQCAMGLGPLSRCNERTRKCECYDVVGNGKNSTAYAPHQCYYRKALGDHCDLNEECQASITPKEAVTCDPSSRRCTCLPGRTCTNVPGSGSAVGKSVGLFFVAVMAIKVLQ